MNKKLNSLLIILVLASTNAQSNELQGLFGLDLNKNITNYLSQDFVIENSSKFSDTIADYQIVNITEKIPNRNPYYSKYFAVIDKFEAIQSISALNLSTGLSSCMTKMNQIKQHFERKYQHSFVSGKSSNGIFEKNRMFTHTSTDNYLELSCMKKKERMFSQIIFNTPKISKAINEFYDSGL